MPKRIKKALVASARRERERAGLPQSEPYNKMSEASARRERADASEGASKLEATERASSSKIEQEIFSELNSVLDPELGIGIVDMGLIYDVKVKGESAHVIMTLTSLGCPVGPYLTEQVRDATLRVPKIHHADVEVVWDPPWSVEKMKPEIRMAVMGY